MNPSQIFRPVDRRDLLDIPRNSLDQHSIWLAVSVVLVMFDLPIDPIRILRTI